MKIQKEQKTGTSLVWLHTLVWLIQCRCLTKRSVGKGCLLSKSFHDELAIYIGPIPSFHRGKPMWKNVIWMHIIEIHTPRPSVHLSWFLRTMLSTTSAVQDYVVHHRALCTTELCCAPPACIVHHGAQGGPRSVRSTDVHFDSAQSSFVLIRWCTRWFCMFIIDH